MRTVCFQNSAASVVTLSWKCDRDSNIITASSTAGTQVLSFEPDYTVALSTAPTVNAVSADKFRFPCSAFSRFEGILKFPILAGETLYCAFSAAKSTAVVVLDDIAESIAT